MLVIGVDAPDATNAEHHDLPVTRDDLARQPARVGDHLAWRVVDALEPVVQPHAIKGLLGLTY